ncbi:MAG: DNA gyrase subunit A, partial [Alphaproteobacteria bacterium]|nr:DNA gyrase subunit A [Alphaproteobacteria bacterium]
EDLIAKEDMAITITNTGYIKRVALNVYKAQNRGGKGRTGMNTKEEDYVTDVFVANTHTPLIFFSNKGIAYQMKVYKLPLCTPQSVGKALINLLPLEQGETISTIMPLPENEEEWSNLYVMFATSKGTVRRNRLSDFLNIRQNGKIAMKFEEEGEELVSVQPCSEDQDVLLTLRGGKCIRFPVPEVRVFQSRNSTGIRGIKVENGDKVISMSIINHTEIDNDTRAAYLKLSRALRKSEFEDLEGEEVLETTKTLSEEEYKALEAKEQFILTVTETGFGKRTSSYEYRITHRGGSGIANIKIAGKTKAVVSSFPIEEDKNILMVTNGGKMIRLGVNKIRIAGRQTMGVTLFKTADDEKVVSVAIAEQNDDEETPIEQDNTPANTSVDTPVTNEVKEEVSETQATEVAEEKTSSEPKTDLFE